MTVGIEAINVYAGVAAVDVRAMFAGRGLDLGRLDNLMTQRRSVSLPCEDAVTHAVNAAKPLLDALPPDERDGVDYLIVGTESGIDLGKSVGTYIHEWLGLPSRCVTFEVKQACYAGTAALRTAAALVASSGLAGTRALAIATDAAGRAEPGGYVEPSEGAGAAAMLVGADPRVLALDPGASGGHTFEVMDTLRPGPDVDVVDSDVSMLAYLTCLRHSFRAYSQRVPGADLRTTFDHLVFHTPFAGMVRGAHRMLLREQAAMAADEIEADFRRRVAPSLAYCSQVGNMFSATLFLALCSLVDSGQVTSPRRVGLFSYGSGCTSEFYSGVITERARPELDRVGIGRTLAGRRLLSLREYDVLNDLAAGRAFGARDQAFDPAPYAGLYADRVEGRGLLVLDRIENYHRRYRWS